MSENSKTYSTERARDVIDEMNAELLPLRKMYAETFTMNPLRSAMLVEIKTIKHVYEKFQAQFELEKAMDAIFAEYKPRILKCKFY